MNRKVNSSIFQLLIVVLLIAAGFFAVKILIATKPSIPKIKPKPSLPTLRVIKSKLKPVRITVSDYGTIEPFRKIDLLPQVSGKVVYVSKNLIDGGSFKKDELLVEIDEKDYRIAYDKALSNIENAKSKLAQLIAESEAAKQEWRSYKPGIKPPPLLIKTPQIAAARADLMAANANLEMAKLNINRTRIYAPCNGKVYSENVAKGQYLNKAQKFATIYCTDKLKVVLYIDPENAPFLKIPGFNSEEAIGSDADIIESLGRRRYIWHGKIIGAAPVDEKTRTLPVIVSIDLTNQSSRYLAIGSFVKAVIKGELINSAMILPQSAIRKDDNGENGVFIVKDGKIVYRHIKLIKESENGVIVGAIKDGDLVVTSASSFLKAGMKVKTIIIKNR